MGLFSKFFGSKPKDNKRFRGQGYSEEGALHHAEQRLSAWLKEQELDGNPIIIQTKSISYIQKNTVLTICYIDCTFKVQS